MLIILSDERKKKIKHMFDKKKSYKNLLTIICKKINNSYVLGNDFFKHLLLPDLL